ncbi:hypothetical protein J3R75_003242 [Oligosphaera ethanolica]|uniref:Uncharacterized protein n=1 Tax=Oligosphaera ethanolica TaxID=760260 RepID=A0AAE3VIQ8_9BACT|nr:hypothetical protein [Oligosphaera ethanolica]
MPHPLMLDARHASRWRGGTRRASPMWRPPGAILCCCHTPGCGALRAPHPGLRMVRPSGPNLADQATCFVRFGPKTTIIQYSCFCAVGAPKSPRGPQAVPGVQGVIPRGPIRPHGPIHGIMPHESVSPRPSAPRQLVPTVLGVPWNRQYQWVRHYAPSSFCISDPSAPTAPTAPTDRRCGRAVPAWLFLATFGAYCLFNKRACRLAPRGTRRSSAVNNKE